MLNSLFVWFVNLPQDVGLDAPGGKLNSLSYAPFRVGQNPLEEKFPTAAQIDEDLQLLSQKTHTIRTYASSRIFNQIAPLAQKYGLKMIQGAWIGYVKEDMEVELAELIKAANTYPDVIKRVIVGNEVLLRGEMEADELMTYIRRVKQAVKQPVSYADVWSMYMKNPQIIKEVDFITIHILPYWEDEPIPVSEAPKHIARIYNLVKQEANEIAPGKPILIGESGWPSAGRQRGWAVPSVTNEASFIRSLIKIAGENNFDYNIVEAFNQPWKDALEGVIGANWGIFSQDRQSMFPLTGKVYENSGWYKQYAAASLLVLVTVLVFRRHFQALSWLKAIGLILFFHILCDLLVNLSCYTWFTSYNFWHYLQTVSGIALNAAFVGLLSFRAHHVLTHQTCRKLGEWLYGLYLLIAVLVLYRTFTLAIDGRYISFSFFVIVIPVVGILGLVLFYKWVNQEWNWALNNLLGHDKTLVHNKIIGYSFLLMIIGMIIGELRAFMIGRDFILAHPEFMSRFGRAFVFTLTNGQLFLWLVCLGILGAVFLANRAKMVRY